MASLRDVDDLVEMRWDFSHEDNQDQASEFETFHATCKTFLVEALAGGNWHIFVAEEDGMLVSHMYLQLIHKVPRPGKSPDPYFGYVTNVYTRPAFRGQGIGSRLQQAMETWSKDQEVEFLLVWPSSTSVDFYERNGFSRCDEAMEKHW
ncbi:GNAT family N-acetyltransferase [Paenibacillus daejeonensis]|uniref:GNAT family N-acetyltransferase n=1 Tax=Paenibacillus daejeonensis TaxID=135193 RepID=UPI001FE1D082|nr:GNAT family N-acetyltransferase [Paenibacillus daejeonensis]